MTTMQVLTIENDNDAPPPNHSKLKRFFSCMPTGFIVLLQIVTLVLFAYTCSELLAMKAAVQPTVKLLSRQNFTYVAESINDVETIIKIIKTDVIPNYYALKPILEKLPQFINKTDLSAVFNDGENIIKIIKTDVIPNYYALKPILKKLPQFINETESFIEQIKKALQPFLSHSNNSTRPNE